MFMLIWTTTPWTLPANLAIAIHPDFTYVAVETKEQIYIMVEDLVKVTMAKAGITDYRIIGKVSPGITQELTFQHPFINSAVHCRLRGVCHEGRGHRCCPHRTRSRRGRL